MGNTDFNRAMALRAMYESMGERTRLTLHQFHDLLTDWELIPVFDGHEVIGGIVRKGRELHIGMKRTPRGSAMVIRQVLEDTIRRHGMAFTKVRLGHAAGLAFCARLGFNAVDDGGYDGNIPMVCDRPRHARKVREPA